MNVHANCILVGRAGEPFGAPPDSGVLLLGQSSSGKSDLSLRLIERGAVLVSDDRTEIFARDGVLHARAAPSLKGLLEIRNLGIVEVPYAAEACIVLVVELERQSTLARLPAREWYRPPAQLDVPESVRAPLLRLDASAPSAVAKVIAAVAVYAEARVRDGHTLAQPSLPVEDRYPPTSFRDIR